MGPLSRARPVSRPERSAGRIAAQTRIMRSARPHAARRMHTRAFTGISVLGPVRIFHWSVYLISLCHILAIYLPLSMQATALRLFGEPCWDRLFDHLERSSAEPDYLDYPALRQTIRCVSEYPRVPSSTLEYPRVPSSALEYPRVPLEYPCHPARAAKWESAVSGNGLSGKWP